MSHHVVVEYEFEGKSGENEVEEVYANQGDHNQRQQLSGNVVSRPCGLRLERYG